MPNVKDLLTEAGPITVRLCTGCDHHDTPQPHLPSFLVESHPRGADSDRPVNYDDDEDAWYYEADGVVTTEVCDETVVLEVTTRTEYVDDDGCLAPHLIAAMHKTHPTYGDAELFEDIEV